MSSLWLLAKLKRSRSWMDNVYPTHRNTCICITSITSQAESMLITERCCQLSAVHFKRPQVNRQNPDITATVLRLASLAITVSRDKKA